MTRYTTPAEARTQAQRINQAPPGLVLLWAHIRTVLADPRANSDHLLIMADALRSDAATLAKSDAHDALIRLAHLLADIAPTRANAIKEPA